METLDDYSGSGNTAAYKRFLAADPPPEGYNAEWVAELRSHTGRGRRIYRVHVLSRPLTPYLRFELGWGYRTNQSGGEEFFILDTTDQSNPLEGVRDFWLFDAQTPVTMHYDASGAVTGRESLPDERAQEFIGYRDTALALAESFSAWWPKYGEA
ncbi:DUF6879 family protein [Streptomyces sp. NPDC021212]|uniref:DUF6879 family protein n=1 Tax=Streptomyces sp. NPDC021212 TaxID=3365118 RepID=UPI003787C2C2